MNIPLVDLGTQHAALGQDIASAIDTVVRNSELIGGRPVREFEQAFAEYSGATHCVGVGNGTDALFLTLKALGVGPGHEVIVPATSFIATAEAVSMTGAQPVFADITPDTFTIDPALAERAVTPRTKAILPVHLYGCPADMAALNAIAERHGLHVVQDAAQAHDAAIDGKPIAEFGPCCYSFYPGKNLGALGDAGAVVTNDESLALTIRKWANHGRIDKYNHEFPGVNSRMDGLQAAVLSVKLAHLEQWTRARREAARRYNRLLAPLTAIDCPAIPEGMRHVFHLYTIRCQDRDGLRRFLGDRGIATGIHYPIALPFLQAYADQGHTPDEFPQAFTLQETTLSLPLFPELTPAQQDTITDAIATWCQGGESA